MSDLRDSWTYHTTEWQLWFSFIALGLCIIIFIPSLLYYLIRFLKNRLNAAIQTRRPHMTLILNIAAIYYVIGYAPMTALVWSQTFFVDWFPYFISTTYVIVNYTFAFGLLLRYWVVHYNIKLSKACAKKQWTQLITSSYSEESNFLRQTPAMRSASIWTKSLEMPEFQASIKKISDATVGLIQTRSNSNHGSIISNSGPLTTKMSKISENGIKTSEKIESVWNGSQMGNDEKKSANSQPNTAEKQILQIFSDEWYIYNNQTYGNQMWLLRRISIIVICLVCFQLGSLYIGVNELFGWSLMSFMFIDACVMIIIIALTFGIWKKTPVFNDYFQLRKEMKYIGFTGLIAIGIYIIFTILLIVSNEYIFFFAILLDGCFSWTTIALFTTKWVLIQIKFENETKFGLMTKEDASVVTESCLFAFLSLFQVSTKRKQIFHQLKTTMSNEHSPKSPSINSDMKHITLKTLIEDEIGLDWFVVYCFFFSFEI